MEIKIIAEASTELERRTIGWGVSFLVDNDLLFDTFSNEDFLKENLIKLGVDIKQLKYVVISHDHWDHTGGLWYILRENPNVNVFICKSSSFSFKQRIKAFGVNIVEVEDPVEIKENIFTTGEIIGKYNNSPLPEQALVVGNDKLTVITGCAHPGIVIILRKVRELFLNPIYLVLGGFHLYDKSENEIYGIIEQFKNLNIERLAPCHCTGERAIDLFKEAFGEKVIEISIGMEIEIS
ncbi:MBL fold metallo-hydrolase [bacterium]|nr:MBL fold metallo-hydrolase [bacterium]